MMALLGGALGLGAPGPTASAETMCALRQITDGARVLFDVGQPSVSGDGRFVAFSADGDLTGDNPDHSREIFRVDLTNGDTAPITHGTPPQVSLLATIDHNGDTIAFTSTTGVAGTGTDNLNIVLWRAGTKTPFTAVTKGTAWVIDPDLSPDGQSVVFTRTEASLNQVRLWKDSVRGTRSLTDDPERNHWHPRFSPDGDQVIVTAAPQNSGSDLESRLLLLELDGTSAVLSRDDYPWSGSISADGDSVATLTRPDTSSNAAVVVWAQRRAGTSVRVGELPDNGSGATEPLLAADGSRIVYVSYGPAANVYLFDPGAPGAPSTRIQHVAEGFRAAIDDSGEHIVFVSHADLTGENADLSDEYFLATCTKAKHPARCHGSMVTVDLGRGDAPTERNDVIRGTAAGDTVHARGGRDIVCGRGGKDTLFGGKGRDLLDGGRRRDVCRGGPGTDTAVRCETTRSIP